MTFIAFKKYAANKVKHRQNEKHIHQFHNTHGQPYKLVCWETTNTEICSKQSICKLACSQPLSQWDALLDVKKVNVEKYSIKYILDFLGFTQLLFFKNDKTCNSAQEKGNLFNTLTWKGNCFPQWFTFSPNYCRISTSLCCCVSSCEKSRTPRILWC